MMKQIVPSDPKDEPDRKVGIDRLLDIRPDPGANDVTAPSFKIGDLAREFGVSLRTLRFYEDRGLLQPERRGTTRIYSRRDRMRLRLVLLAKLLGFSLTEAKQIIEIYHQPDGRRRQLEVALDRLKDQHVILLEQKQEIEESLQAMEVTLQFVRDKLAGDRSRDDT